MGDRFQNLHDATAEAVLRGPGTTPAELRQAVARGEAPEALRVLVEKIRRHAYRVTDEDLSALRGRYSEDQIFELVVAATLGAAEERLRAGLRALDDAVTSPADPGRGHDT
jgi:alkylhydroperoxidase family enzyme